MCKNRFDDRARLRIDLNLLLSSEPAAVAFSSDLTTRDLFDAAALWVFLFAFGVTMPVDAILIAFGVANVMPSMLSS